MTKPQNTRKPLEEALTDAIGIVRGLELNKTVQLAVQALLLMRGALNFEGNMFNPYPVLVKYIRASNAETLGALADEVIRAISPNFITLRSLGELAEAIYCPQTELGTEALKLLQEETTPLVILMKKIYQDARGFDEADGTQSEEAKEGETQRDTN